MRLCAPAAMPLRLRLQKWKEQVNHACKPTQANRRAAVLVAGREKKRKPVWPSPMPAGNRNSLLLTLAQQVNHPSDKPARRDPFARSLHRFEIAIIGGLPGVALTGFLLQTIGQSHGEPVIIQHTTHG